MGRPKGSRNGTRTSVKLICKICNKEFEVRNYRKDIATYCSQKCYGIFNKGKPSLRRGYKHSEKTKIKISASHKTSPGCIKQIEKLAEQFKGKHRSPKTEFKRGHNMREAHPRWKGGKHLHKAGYIMTLAKDHPTTKQRYILEHRLVVEQQIGRPLSPEEATHHLGEKSDNRPQMLMAFVSNSAHKRFERGGIVKPKEIIFDGRLLK
jgi:hypothetical protein